MKHAHSIVHMPATGTGWAVCSCGATLRVEAGKPKGAWHACALCVAGHKEPAKKATP